MKLDTIQKIQKELPDFCSEVASLSVEQLDARLASLAKDRESNKDAKDADEGLAQAKAEARELGQPYRDASKVISQKSTYIVSLIQEKGGKV